VYNKQRQWVKVSALSRSTQSTAILELSAFKQAAAVLTMNGDIAAATYRITLALDRYSLYFTMGQETKVGGSSKAAFHSHCLYCNNLLLLLLILHCLILQLG